MTFSNEIQKKLELFTKQNDITTINNIEEKIESLLAGNLFDLEVRVADMEYGNKNLEVDKTKFKLIYDGLDDKSFFEDNKNQNLHSYGGRSLDKNGNVVQYQFFMSSYGYNSDMIFGLINLFFWIGIISLISFLTLKFKLNYDKKHAFS